MALVNGSGLMKIIVRFAFKCQKELEMLSVLLVDV